MQFVLISDTHERHSQVQVPNGDVLIHAGDFTMLGEEEHIENFNHWLGKLPHKFKVVIPGNHELGWSAAKQALLTNATHVLLDSGTDDVGGFRLYGSPFTPTFGGWAFMLPRGQSIYEKWLQIPHETDVLITHGPPRGILDNTPSGELCGCADLRYVVEGINPRLHVFGHIHNGYGTYQGCLSKTIFVNAASVDEMYRPVHEPIVIELS